MVMKLSVEPVSSAQNPSDSSSPQGPPVVEGEILLPGRARTARRAALPPELTSFIGREQEIAEVKSLLGDRRLLTLYGSGGSGKTRLALAVAQDLVEGYDGNDETARLWRAERSKYPND